jgi:hypothetical protein
VSVRLVDLLTEVIEHRALWHVRAELKREKAARAARAKAATPAAPSNRRPDEGKPSVGGAPIDDRTTAFLLHRMRGLLLEERFRHGVLR